MMSTVSEKLLQVAQNNPKVHHSGQLNIVKNAECLKGTKSDTAMLLDDISPVTHEMGVRVRGKNLFDYSVLENADYITVNDRLTGEFVFKQVSAIPETPIPAKENTSYYVSGYMKGVTEGQNVSCAAYYTDGSNTNFTATTVLDSYVRFSGVTRTDKTLSYIKFGASGGIDVGTSFKNVQVELNSETAYTPYVSDLTAVKVSRCGKNLLSYPYVETTLTRNGITFTDNGDGTITANGTATADTQFRLQDTVVYPDNYNPFKYLIGKVVGINGSPDGSSKDTYAIQSIQTGNYGNTGFTISNSNRYRFAIFIKSGITVSNLVFKPMIYLSGVTNYDYEFYNRAEYTPTADGTVEGVTSLYPVTQIMTDTDGVIIDCEYYKDVDKAFDELTTSVALSGGDS